MEKPWILQAKHMFQPVELYLPDPAQLFLVLLYEISPLLGLGGVDNLLQLCEIVHSG